jgi:hypothetical protein
MADWIESQRHIWEGGEGRAGLKDQRYIEELGEEERPPRKAAATKARAEARNQVSASLWKVRRRKWKRW